MQWITLAAFPRGANPPHGTTNAARARAYLQDLLLDLVQIRLQAFEPLGRARLHLLRRCTQHAAPSAPLPARRARRTARSLNSEASERPESFPAILASNTRRAAPRSSFTSNCRSICAEPRPACQPHFPQGQATSKKAQTTQRCCEERNSRRSSLLGERNARRRRAGGRLAYVQFVNRLPRLVLRVSGVLGRERLRIVAPRSARKSCTLATSALQPAHLENGANVLIAKDLRRSVRAASARGHPAPPRTVMSNPPVDPPRTRECPAAAQHLLHAPATPAERAK
jgi:hypothetical protein